MIRARISNLSIIYTGFPFQNSEPMELNKSVFLLFGSIVVFLLLKRASKYSQLDQSQRIKNKLE